MRVEESVRSDRVTEKRQKEKRQKERVGESAQKGMGMKIKDILAII